jgi:hypothetical protein
MNDDVRPRATGLADRLATQYKYLFDDLTKFEGDYRNLRQYIGSHVQQIQLLNADFERLQRGG